MVVWLGLNGCLAFGHWLSGCGSLIVRLGSMVVGLCVIGCQALGQWLSGFESLVVRLLSHWLSVRL